MTITWRAIAICTILILPAHESGAAHLHKGKLSCKHVRDAVWAGHTIEQLTAEFDTDAQHIMACVQSRKGKKKSAPKAKGKAAHPRAVKSAPGGQR